MLSVLRGEKLLDSDVKLTADGFHNDYVETVPGAWHAEEHDRERDPGEELAARMPMCYDVAHEGHRGAGIASAGE